MRAGKLLDLVLLFEKCLLICDCDDMLSRLKILG